MQCNRFVNATGDQSIFTKNFNLRCGQSIGGLESRGMVGPKPRQRGVRVQVRIRIV